MDPAQYRALYKSEDGNIGGLSGILSGRAKNPLGRLLTGKWTGIVIHHLADGPMRFGELQRRIPAITQAALTQQLRVLEDYGLVHREIFPEVPPHVEYSLTQMGEDYLDVQAAMREWILKHYDELASISENENAKNR